MTNSLSGKTAILGIGAQKAGTTWLFNYLNACRVLACSPLKEMHFFDARCRRDLCGGFDTRSFETALQNLNSMANINAIRSNSMLQARIDRIQMIFSSAAYLDHFRRITPPEVNHFCEITPSYSLLRTDGFEFIKSMMGSNGIKVKFIMLLRDPVERHWSHVRFQQNQSSHFDAKRDFVETLEQPGFLERTRYDLTIQNLMSVFGREDVYFEFYERMFDSGRLERLMTFLGLPFHKPDLARRKNVSAEIGGLRDSDRLLAISKYKSVYDFCHEFFHGQLPNTWLKHMAMPSDA
ncbi:MAG: hypothetical protein GVY36_14105 [Verrucomicrobia bacterium]|jgi:hypothetical protein|nr:hypothetical protein [Verrucomicrobiota bacterium]